MIRRTELNWRTTKDKLSDTGSVNFLLSMGFIYKIQSGIYGITPFGNMFLDTLKSDLTDSMNAIGYHEITNMPISGKQFWNKREGIVEAGYSFDDFVLHTTSEETIFGVLPQALGIPFRVFSFSYNFRNELRPAFGLCRTTCFIMKDAYSMFETQEELDREYIKAKNAYKSFFSIYDVDLITKDIGTECEFLGVSSDDEMKSDIFDSKHVVELGHLFKFSEWGKPSMSFGIGVTRFFQYIVSKGKINLCNPFIYAVVPKHPNSFAKAMSLYEKLVQSFDDKVILFDDSDKTFGEKMFDLNFVGFVEENILVV